MGALAIVLAVQSRTGSFAAAGASSGAFGFANVVAAPWRARAIDRWGQRLALTPLGLAQTAAFLALAVAANVRSTSTIWFIALSIAVGLVAPPLGGAMRAIWATSTSVGAERTRALSLDATADDVVFIVGPAVAAMLATQLSPSAALLAAAIAVLSGTLGVTTSHASRTLRGAPPVPGKAERPLHRPGFARVLVVLVGVGVVLGTLEVAAPAVAVADHAKAASGWLLAALSVGSVIGGLIYGHVSWQGVLGLRMLVLSAAMGAVTCGIAFVDAVPAFVVGAVGIGLFLAPSIVTGYLAAECLVPARAATEASVWTNTALNLGAAAANAAAGALIAGPGVTSAMLVAGSVAIAAALCTPRARLQNQTIPR